MKALGILVLLVVVASSGCDDDEAPITFGADAAERIDAGARVVPRGEARGPELATPTAFDMALAPDGAVVVWGGPSGRGVALRALRLARDGARVGEAFTAAALDEGTHAVEVSAAASGPRIGVAWVARHGTSARVFGALGDLDSRVFSDPSPVGSVDLARVGQRGHVEVAASERGEIFVFRRGVRAPCREPDAGSCTGFGFAELRETGVESRGLALSVPSACDVGIGALVVQAARRYYGVCTREQGRRRNTVFLVQFHPEYARTHEILPGCGLRGAVLLGDEVVVAGDCSAGPRAVRLPGFDAPEVPLDLSKLEVRCRGGAIALVTDGGNAPPFEHVLRGPVPRLGPVLPAALRPSGARAVYTGASLLVAAPRGNRLSLVRHRCEQGRLSTAELSLR